MGGGSYKISYRTTTLNSVRRHMAFCGTSIVSEDSRKIRTQIDLGTLDLGRK